MATLTVRVAPRSGRTAVEIGPDGVVVRVRSAPTPTSWNGVSGALEQVIVGLGCGC